MSFYSYSISAFWVIKLTFADLIPGKEFKWLSTVDEHEVQVIPEIIT